MPRRSQDRLIQLIDRLALLVALTVALILPLGYSGLTSMRIVDHVDTLAQVKAGVLTNLVSGNPALWTYQAQRMQDLLTYAPSPLDGEMAGVYDANGVLLTSVGSTPVPPLLKRSFPLYDSGRIVGRVEIAYSLRRMIVGTALAGMLGLVLGGSAYGVFRTWPLRELKRMGVRLAAEHAALRTSEERYRTLIDWSPEPVTVLRDGRINYVNPAAVKMFGATSAQDLAGKPMLDLVHPDFHEIALARMRNITDHGVNAPMIEMGFLALHGTAIDLEVQGTAIVYDGEPAVHVAMRNVTERKRAEGDLRESERRFRELVDSTDGIVWQADAATFVFSFVSNNAERILGYPVADWRQPGFWASHVHAQDRDEAVNYCVASTSQLEDHEFEYRFIAQDGRVVWLRDIVKVVEENGKPRWIRGLMVDITERKQAESARAMLESQLRESQKMEAIGTLAGGIAHDFNNVLATILGNTELARLDLSTNPRALVSLEEIHKAGSHARDLVQQILAFSRRQPTERKVISLAPVIDEFTRLLRATLPARVVLDVHCETGIPAVLADATQIQQVLINLVTNAQFAMRDGRGRIGVRLDTLMVNTALTNAHPALVAMQAKYPGRTLRLTVSDNGSGMDAATLERIFEPFFTTKAVDEGTGLGLSVVHGIVQGHDGVIEVDSEPGKGTTFTVYLPTALAQPGALEPVAVAADTRSATHVDGGQRILYIDDDEGLVSLVKRSLERRGFRISAYTDSRKALAALRAEPTGFDLVVTDYNMPGMSGLDVAREVRAIRADLPLAVASGFIDETLREQAGAAGVRELIFKAAKVETLCDAFARLATTVATQHKATMTKVD